MSKGSSAVRRGLVVGLLLTATASGVPQLVASAGRASTPPPVPPACELTVCPEPLVPTPQLPDPSLPAVDLAVPGGSVTVPGGTVTVPGGNVTVPGGTVTVPGGTVTVPGGTVTVPGGDVAMPGGNVAGGNVAVPGGNVAVPGGNVTVPGGNVTVPGGTEGDGDQTPGDDTGGDPGTVPGTPPGTGVPGGPGLLWSADFESGDLSGFEDTPWNQVGSGPPRILTLTDGTKALGLTIPARGARNEVVPDIPALREGDDLYFGFSTFLAPGFPVDGSWQVLAQWKNDGTGSPPISLSVEGGRFMVDGGWGHPDGHQYHYQRDLGPAVAGVWNDWVFHIRFSDAPTSGFAEVWRDSQQVLGKFSPPGGTLYPGLNSYVKTGYYRDEDISVAGTVVLDDWRVGTTYAAVSGTTPPGTAVAGALADATAATVHSEPHAPASTMQKTTQAPPPAAVTPPPKAVTPPPKAVTPPPVKTVTPPTTTLPPVTPTFPPPTTTPPETEPTPPVSSPEPPPDEPTLDGVGADTSGGTGETGTGEAGTGADEPTGD